MLVSIGKTRRSGELVDLLLECHGKIRQFTALARDAGERPSLSEPEVVDACQRVERYFVEALPLHVRDEEESIEPRLSGRSEALDRDLQSMQLEHREHDALVAALVGACRALCATPLDAERRRELSQAAERLSLAIEPHLELEETRIFPALRELLTAEQRATISSELRARRQAP